MIPTITFYDIPSKNGPWSGNTLKTRYALNFKNLPYKTHWIEYPDIAEVGQSIGAKPVGKTPNTDDPQWTCPMISVVLPDDEKATVVTDSGDIADFLDAEPALNGADTPMLFPLGTRDVQDSFLTAAVSNSIIERGIIALGASGSAAKLLPRSEEYFRRTRLEWYGGNTEWLGERAAHRKLPLEEWVPLGSAYREEAWAKVKAAWGRAAKIFMAAKDSSAAGPWLFGTTPVYADLVLLAWLAWLKHVSTEDEWGKVLSWDDGLWATLWDASKPLRAQTD
ncbi:hypothetical protein BKA62DRAFT_354064 [Auriculariales sp. MPI-PUGE-AT-0066]|nr:hypothetical protein BKA62DRAFT_354064 [Auriculariales sp. MPI-PUGE-AT-0066]